MSRIPGEKRLDLTDVVNLLKSVVAKMGFKRSLVVTLGSWPDRDRGQGSVITGVLAQARIFNRKERDQFFFLFF